jgi:hypothetical protein
MPADDERQTFGQQIIAWIEATCRVPEGALVGRPLELMAWQKREKGAIMAGSTAKVALITGATGQMAPTSPNTRMFPFEIATDDRALRLHMWFMARSAVFHARELVLPATEPARPGPVGVLMT